MATIKLTINPDGTFSHAVDGVKGSSCTQVTDFLDKEFGIGKQKKTAEYYQIGGNVVGVKV